MTPPVPGPIEGGGIYTIVYPPEGVWVRNESGIENPTRLISEPDPPDTIGLRAARAFTGLIR